MFLCSIWLRVAQFLLWKWWWFFFSFFNLQLVPVVFHKSANGVKVDPSAEKDCVSSKRIYTAVCQSHVDGYFVTVLFSYIYFLFEFLGWWRCKSRASLLAFSGVIFEASCINKCSILLQSKVITIVFFLFITVFFFLIIWRCEYLFTYLVLFIFSTTRTRREIQADAANVDLRSRCPYFYEFGCKIAPMWVSTPLYLLYLRLPILLHMILSFLHYFS